METCSSCSTDVFLITVCHLPTDAEQQGPGGPVLCEVAFVRRSLDPLIREPYAEPQGPGLLVHT